VVASTKSVKCSCAIRSRLLGRPRLTLGSLAKIISKELNRTYVYGGPSYLRKARAVFCGVFLDGGISYMSESRKNLGMWVGYIGGCTSINNRSIIGLVGNQNVLLQRTLVRGPRLLVASFNSFTHAACPVRFSHPLMNSYSSTCATIAPVGVFVSLFFTECSPNVSCLTIWTYL
jgi:hypothetical protein